MRLIDAEKLQKTTGFFIYKSKEEDTDVVTFEMYSPDDIKNAKTIRAIPIEWIRNYVSIWISEPYKNFALNMITKWEKENEID